MLFLLISLFSAYLLIIKTLLPDDEKVIKTFVISSGSEGGSYYKAGQGIEEELNRIANKKYFFKNIPSNGSIENIKRLKSRYADFAIVQRDELIKNYHGDGDNVKNITVISPLFQEKLLIYSHTESHISFKKFKELLLQPSRPIRIGVTSKNGTAFKTFSDISQLLSLTTENIEFVENNYSELINNFKSNDIDFILTFSLSIKEIEEADTSLVYFSDEDILLLTNRMRYFSQATITNDPQYKTLGVWSLLIGLNSSTEEVGDGRILNYLTSNNSGKNSFSSQIKSTLNLFKTNTSMYDEYLSTLPNAPALLKRINKLTQYNYWYLISIAIILMITVYFYKGFLNKNKKHWKYLWIRYNHILIGSIVVIICYLLCIEFLVYNEEVLFNSTGIKSRILDLPRADLHMWNTIRMFAQIDGGIFPYSLYGKLVTALSTYLTLFGAIAIALSEFGMNKLTAKRRGGKMKIELESHVIISGWNNNSMRLIEDLFTASKEYHNKSIKIVCVVQDPTSILKSYPEISDLEHAGEVTFVQGDIRSKEVALQSNAYLASSIILTAEDTTTGADEKTLLRALSVTKFNRKQREEQGIKNKTDIFESRSTKSDINSTYIIAEINNEEFVEDLHNAGVNGIVNRGQITKNILIQSLLNPGVSILLNNVLSFSGDTNEFYTVDLREEANKHLRYKCFDELILPLRKQNILLLAIKVVYLDDAGRIIVDVDELDRLLKEDKLNRQIITNPINDAETRREADGNDHLIVLAVSTKELKEGLAKVSF